MSRSRRFTAAATSLGLAVGLSLVGAATAQADDFDVCAAGCDFSTISAAIAAAESGATIRVAAGDYAETVTIDKPLTLVGPNASVSPNTADPLVANGARALEAVIRPDAGSTNHGIILTSAATPVSISGFTVDLTDRLNDQRYVNAGTATNRTVTLERNRFVGGAQSTNGHVVIDGGLGTASITVTDNRFTGAGASNGLRIHNSSAGATTTVSVSNNVWLDNKGLAANFSNSSGTTTGSFSNNWIGNSTPGTGGVDNFGKRQGGMVLANAFAGLQITGNTYANIEDAAISLWSGLSGDLQITGNAFNGYSNVAGYAAVYVRHTESRASDLSGVVFSDNRFDNPTTGSRALLNRADTGQFDATNNWWGQASGPAEGQIVGPNVLVTPWLGGTSDAGTEVHVVPAEAESELVGAPGAPLVVLDPASLPASGAQLEYSVLPEASLPSVKTTPFAIDGATLLDISLVTAPGESATGPFTVCFDGAAPQRIWHFEGGEWVDFTDRVLGGGTIVPVPGKLCGMVPSFSPFAIAAAAATTPTTPGGSTTTPAATGDVLPATGVSAWAAFLAAALLLAGGAGMVVVARRRSVVTQRG